MGIQDRDYYWEHRDKLERQQSNKRFIKRPQPTITPSKRTEPAVKKNVYYQPKEFRDITKQEKIKTAPIPRFVKRSRAILFVLISSVSVAVITFFTTLLIAMDNPRLLTPAIELISFLQEFLS